MILLIYKPSRSSVFLLVSALICLVMFSMTLMCSDVNIAPLSSSSSPSTCQ